MQPPGGRPNKGPSFRKCWPKKEVTDFEAEDLIDTVKVTMEGKAAFMRELRPKPFSAQNALTNVHAQAKATRKVNRHLATLTTAFNIPLSPNRPATSEATFEQESNVRRSPAPDFHSMTPTTVVPRERARQGSDEPTEPVETAAERRAVAKRRWIQQVPTPPPKPIKPRPDFVQRNVVQVHFISEYMRGAVDFDSNAVQQRHQRDWAATTKRGWAMRKEHITAIQKTSECREAERAMKRDRMDNVEDFVVRACAWAVAITLYKMNRVAWGGIAHGRLRTRRHRTKQAVAVLTRSLPIVFKRFRRRKRLRRFMVVARVLWLCGRAKLKHKTNAVRKVLAVFRTVTQDPLIHVKRYYRATQSLMKMCKRWVVCRRHRSDLLRRQWEAMETYILLAHPAVGVPDLLLESIPHVSQSADGQYNFLPPMTDLEMDWLEVLTVHKKRRRMLRDEIHEMDTAPPERRNTLASIQRLLLFEVDPDEDRDSDQLPPTLRQFRSLPNFRDSIILEAAYRRQKNLMRLVHQHYVVFEAMRTSSDDEFRVASQKHRVACAQAVKEKHPQYPVGTPIYNALLDIERRARPNTSMMLLAKNKALQPGKVPKFNYTRTLFEHDILGAMVSKALRQSKLSRMLKKTHTDVSKLGPGNMM